MVQACAKAARSVQGVSVVLKHARDTEANDILSASGFVFATPEYLGSMSGLMKDCFDRTYYPCLDKVQARPYGILVCAGSDGHGAAKQIERIVTGWRLKRIALPVIVNVSAQTPQRILAPKTLSNAQLSPCAELGTLLANGLSMGVF